MSSAAFLLKILGKNTLLNTWNAIFRITSCFFIFFFAYFIIFWCSQVVYISKLIRADFLWNSTVQRWSALMSTETFSFERRWFKENEGWSAQKQRWSALVISILSRSEIIAEQRWRTSSLWNSAFQRWLCLRLQRGYQFFQLHFCYKTIPKRSAL